MKDNRKKILRENSIVKTFERDRDKQRRKNVASSSRLRILFLSEMMVTATKPFPDMCKLTSFKIGINTTLCFKDCFENFFVILEEWKLILNWYNSSKENCKEGGLYFRGMNKLLCYHNIEKYFLLLVMSQLLLTKNVLNVICSVHSDVVYNIDVVLK